MLHLCPAPTPTVHTVTKGMFQIILFNQLNLLICANICFILMQLQLLKTSVIFTAYLSMPELWLSQTLVQQGCKMQGWEGKGMKEDKTRCNLKPNKSRICSQESEKFNSMLNPICLKGSHAYIRRKWSWWKYCQCSSKQTGNSVEMLCLFLYIFIFRHTKVCALIHILRKR